MSKKRSRHADSVEGLAEWSAEMAAHNSALARAADPGQRRRSLEFRAAQHARIATVLREFVNAAKEIA
jgi:hypothetical protein